MQQQQKHFSLDGLINKSLQKKLSGANGNPIKKYSLTKRTI